MGQKNSNDPKIFLFRIYEMLDFKRNGAEENLLYQGSRRSQRETRIFRDGAASGWLGAL